MRIVNTGFHRILEVFSKYFFLNMLWLFLCLPVFTVFASTAAMFAVVRNWTLQKETSHYLADFIYQFKTNFIKSTLVGITWSFFGLVIGLYTFINLQVSSTILFVALIFISLVYFFISGYLFPVLVHYDIEFRNIFKFSFIYSFSQIGYTFLIFLIKIIFGLVIFLQPFFILILFSVCTHIVYFICQKSFSKIEKRYTDSNK